jgi:hypothetical protein
MGAKGPHLPELKSAASAGVNTARLRQGFGGQPSRNEGWLANRSAIGAKVGGHGRNRTGVHGLEIRFAKPLGTLAMRVMPVPAAFSESMRGYLRCLAASSSCRTKPWTSP